MDGPALSPMSSDQLLVDSFGAMSLTSYSTTPFENNQLLCYLKANKHSLSWSGGKGPVSFNAPSGETFEVWYSHIEGMDVINIQNRENFYSIGLGNKLQKLGIKLDKTGTIVSVYVDGNTCPSPNCQKLFLAYTKIIKENKDCCKFGRTIIQNICKPESRNGRTEIRFAAQNIEILFGKHCTELKDAFFKATCHRRDIETDKDYIETEGYCGIVRFPVGIEPLLWGEPPNKKYPEVIAAGKRLYCGISEGDVIEKGISIQTIAFAFIQATKVLILQPSVILSDIEAFEKPENSPLLRFVNDRGRLQLEIFYRPGTWKMKDITAEFMHGRYGDFITIQKDHVERIDNTQFIGKFTISHLSLISDIFIKWIFQGLSDKIIKDLLSCLVKENGFDPQEMTQKIIHAPKILDSQEEIEAFFKKPERDANDQQILKYYITLPGDGRQIMKNILYLGTEDDMKTFCQYYPGDLNPFIDGNPQSSKISISAYTTKESPKNFYTKFFTMKSFKRMYDDSPLYR